MSLHTHAHTCTHWHTLAHTEVVTYARERASSGAAIQRRAVQASAPFAAGATPDFAEVTEDEIAEQRHTGKYYKWLGENYGKDYVDSAESYDKFINEEKDMPPMMPELVHPLSLPRAEVRRARQ